MNNASASGGLLWLIALLTSYVLVRALDRQGAALRRAANTALAVPAALCVATYAMCLLPSGCGGTGAVGIVAIFLFVFVSVPVAGVLYVLHFWSARRAERTSGMTNGSLPVGFGYCPNCNTLLPLSSSDCPRCKAIFNEGAAWHVTRTNRDAT